MPVGIPVAPATINAGLVPVVGSKEIESLEKIIPAAVEAAEFVVGDALGNGGFHAALKGMMLVGTLVGMLLGSQPHWLTISLSLPQHEQ